ncbi:nucleotide exchange factor GrpE [Candidatus Berkelbacteria bacterium]|nr:nucleotide exchange factor GrpE [Candidatus Berkelbacteria bacterium]
MAEKKQSKIQELEYLLKRVQADFDNYRKRTEEEKQQFMQFANANFLLDMLPVIDNFKRAAEHVPDHLKDDNWAKGMRAIERQLEDILQQNGLEEIAVKPGDEFDPTKHEVISQEQKEGSISGTISKVIASGYLVGGRVLRPARVIVTH